MNSSVCLFVNNCTSCVCPPHRSSVAAGFDPSCVTERKMEGRRCTGVAAEAHLGGHGGLSQRCDSNDEAMRVCCGDAVALDCGSHGNSVVQVQSLDQGLQAERSSGHSGKSGGNHFLQCEGSSPQRGYRLNKERKQDG